ncbi:DUF2868 domain-containing protein [Ectothiorhodospira lacustris]|uniref:DUF2868 domain-containing protein n=1 Tax=Ectothiorhodospira lacustris TaxID=2899127 RepID=UPI001EE9651E|nr:DUF2868 domain-containing protein [Ectothiorhodospira lacustris]MCG5500787.1 DUF2868 domain-containing protein [Ectothiorhodospira lacustris]MCG5509352.1 DUF2868 domain-containing protein [Ectothiorhodospira lacustris]MCG5521406.1 DUF2868 domain-containing protein [Ectothiorhodospira lacustris]
MNTHISDRASPAPHDRFTDRLVAEAVRLHEDSAGRVIDETPAWQAGRDAAGDLEHRVLVRAGATRLGIQVHESLSGARALAGWILALILLLTGLSGMAAAGAALAAPLVAGSSQINILWTLGSLLGVQLLMLLLWALIMLVRPRGGGGLLGQGVLGLGGGLARRIVRGQAPVLAIRALLQLMSRNGLGRWSAGTLTHLIWSAFTAGALFMCLWALSVRQYDFVWGTTLLAEDHFVGLITALGLLPGWLGLPMPDEALIRASRLGVTEDALGRVQWSSWLLGSLLFYGLLPRLGLGLWCALMARRARRSLRLDLASPGYARLAHRLLPNSQRLGVVDPPPLTLIHPPEPLRHRERHGGGALALLGFELEKADSHWIQHHRRPDWIPLGQVDDRHTRRDVLAAAQSLQPDPAVVVAVCSLARTPDRSTEGFLTELRSRTRAPVWVLLDEQNMAQARGIDLRARRTAWEQLVDKAGVDRLLPERPADGDRPAQDILLAAFASAEDATP